MPRSIRMTVVASVIDPACPDVSLMRMKSPPMLLGRKLLKKVAIRYELISQPRRAVMPCAVSSRCHRHALTMIIAR